jgi:hypothetical protein
MKTMTFAHLMNPSEWTDEEIQSFERYDKAFIEFQDLPHRSAISLLARYSTLMYELEHGIETPDWIVERIKKSRVDYAKIAGAKGGQARVKKLDPLKKWAMEANAKLKRGSPRDRARELIKTVPKELAELSKDPERIIRETIR